MKKQRTKELQTVEIEGGKYTLTVERVKYLAEEFSYSIETNAEFIESLNGWKVKAVLTIIEKDEHGNVEILNYSGHGFEVIGSTEINSTNALENAETSAVGRACGNAGIGLTDNFASADEMNGAKEKTKQIAVQKRIRASKTAEEKTLEKLTSKAVKK